MSSIMKGMIAMLFALVVMPQCLLAQEAVAQHEMRKQFLQLQSTIHEQNQLIKSLLTRVDVLETQMNGRMSTISLSRPDAAGPAMEGLSQGFNPEIGVVATVQAHITENTEDGEGNDTIALKELEINFAQYVDPYSRLDAIITLNDDLEENLVEIEEAYYTHWGLPLGFVARAGKIRPKIGKQNVLHLHQLDTVDYPLVIQDFFGEEGLAASGVRLQNFIPNPWDIPLQITGEVLRGNNGNSFSQISRRPIFNSHLSSFFELSDDIELELGTTAMFGEENVSGGSQGDNRFGVHVFGFDATLNWYLPEGKKAKLQGELYFQDRTDLVKTNFNPWGFYLLADYRFHPKWSAGVRVDYLETLDTANEHTFAVSPYLTFWQSEFANFRLQLQHLNPADGQPDNGIFLQGNFAIGEHRHPVQ